MGARSWRAGNKQPQSREAQKPKQKKTLGDECKARINKIQTSLREREAREQQEANRAAEEEVLKMIYGPNWKSPHATERVSSPRLKVANDEYDDEDEE